LCTVHGDDERQQPKDRRVDHGRQLISHAAETLCRTVDRKVGHYGPGVNRSTLQFRMKKLGIERPSISAEVSV